MYYLLTCSLKFDSKDTIENHKPITLQCCITFIYYKIILKLQNTLVAKNYCIIINIGYISQL